MPDSNRRDANRTEENPRIDKARILKDRLEKKYAERNRERGDSRPQRSDSQLSTPGTRKPKLFSSPNPDAFGRMTEGFARYMGTPQFLMWMTIFCGVWLAWNSLAPEEMQFDPRSLNFTLLTLMLSLQASYAAPLLLLAQNRQDDRDRVVASEDRKRDQQNLEETQYLTREIASLRIALREVATRDFVRSELRDILEELQNIAQEQERHAEQLQDISEDIEDLEEAIDDIDISSRSSMSSLMSWRRLSTISISPRARKRTLRSRTLRSRALRERALKAPRTVPSRLLTRLNALRRTPHRIPTEAI